MAQNEAPLVKLSDSGFILEDPDQDLRGLDVYDRDGEKVGTVKDFYVDPEERKVRFLEVGVGGFLGIGKKHFLIPLEAVRDTSEDRVSIDQSRERVMRAPDLRVDAAPTVDYLRGIYSYYGYPAPLGPPFAIPAHPGTAPESSRQAPHRRRTQ
jgi:sporulation protein YlmC with PRC-barrel domain